MDARSLAVCQNRTFLKAPSKLNIGLSIVGRRSDGYHLLESLFWPVDLVDEIELLPNSTPCKITTQWADDAPSPNSPLPDEKSNLLSKVLEKLPHPVTGQIVLRKKIPLGGGLGGGSSDAGTLLRHLSGQFPQYQSTFEKLAPTLGADVPFFLNPIPTLVNGIGEKRNTLQVDPDLYKNLAFLLVFPPFPSITRKAYEGYRNSKKSFSKPHQPFPDNSMKKELFKTYIESARNDLESIVAGQYPIIGQILEELRKTQCLYASLSGSGSTCYAIYSSHDALVNNLKVLGPFLRKNNCNSVTALTYTLNH